MKNYKEAIKMIFQNYEEYMDYFGGNSMLSNNWFSSGLLGHLKKALIDGVGDWDFLEAVFNENNIFTYISEKLYGELDRKTIIVEYIDHKPTRKEIEDDEYDNGYVMIDDNNWFKVSLHKGSIKEFLKVVNQFLIFPKIMYYDYDAYIGKFTKNKKLYKE